MAGNRANYMQIIILNYVLRFEMTSSILATIFLEFPIKSTEFYDFYLQWFRSSIKLGAANTVALSLISSSLIHSVSFPQPLIDIINFGDL